MWTTYGMDVNGCVGSVEVETERCKEKLLAAMQWPEGLQKEELGKLKELVLEFEDVFALSDDELGCTEVARHKIDTGDHAPTGEAVTQGELHLCRRRK